MATRIPGGPDPLPGANRTTNNARATVRPVRAKLKKPKNPKIVWYGRSKPKLDPKKYKVAKRGGGLGYVATRIPAAAPAAAPPAPAGPYAEYADYPWAQQQLKQLDRDQAFHQTYASDKVLPWASQALTNLTGVDPNQPGINPVLQQQYLANVQGNVGGALNAAAAAGQAPNIAATTPGGVMASPTAYLSQAASEGARGMASSYLQSAQVQSALNTMQPNLMAQSYVMQLGDYAKGLPAVYAEKRSELRSSIDKFISDAQQEAAQQAETMRHNRVTEAISAQNAQTQAALGFGNLGLNTTKEGNDQAAVTAAASTPAPYGYNRDPATGKLVRDPSIPTASTGTTANPTAQGKKYTESWFKEKGYVKVPAKAGAKYQAAAIASVDGSGKWLKPAKGTTTKPTAAQVKAAAGAKAFDVQKALASAYDGGLIDDGDQNKGTGQLLRFLRGVQPTNKANFAKWWASVLPVLRDQDPKFAAWMEGYRRRRVADGSWKGAF